MSKLSEEQLIEIVQPLLEWYQKCARVLPWRSDPTPYHVWISEIMLQQTRVEAVKEYYQRFLKELPTIQHLAEVPEQQLLKLWEGLGYYNRAKNLQKAAKQIVTEYQGKLPPDYQKLQKLPGIGRYTAGAIGSIAFGLPVAAVDGNVLRVLSRLLASKDNISKNETKLKYENLLSGVLVEMKRAYHPGAFTQALMELGAMVCVPNGAPKCLLCPLQQLCQAYEKGIAESLPIKDGKKARRVESKTVFVLTCENRIAIRKRPETGLLSSLWELPNVEGILSQKQVKEQLKNWDLEVVTIQKLEKAKHIFTHIEWNMIGFEITVKSIENNHLFLWSTIQELKEQYPLPTAFGAYSPIKKQG